MTLTQNRTTTLVTETWLPLRRYQLTLRHKLLKELGEISHFVLKALQQSPLNMDDFEVITGLSAKQLSPVLQRLGGLKLIDRQGQLTPSGQSIAYILQYLHQQKICLWLDHRYHSEKKTILMLKGNSLLVKKQPEKTYTIETKKLERDWNTDCFYQTERIRKSISVVLPWLFKEFETLPNIEAIKWGQEWELDLQVDKNFSDGFTLPIELELSSQLLENPVISLFTKTLALETHFELAQGVDLEQSLECPKSLKFQYSFAEESFHNDLIYVENVDPDKKLESSEYPEDKEIAMELLKRCYEATDESNYLFNRHHTFHTFWQQHDADWTHVCKCLPVSEDILKGGIG